MTVDALVFAAGRGTRLRPHTDDTPKPLLEVGGKPLLSWCLRSVVDAGADRLVLVVGYRGDAVRAHFGEQFGGVPITYAVQHERLGLAHAVLTAEPHVEGETLLCVNGDNLFDCDLSRLLERHRDPGVDGTVLLDRVSRNAAETKGQCDLEADGTIVDLESSTESRQTDTAPYMAAGAQTHTHALFDACRRLEPGESGEYELTDALQSLVERGTRYVGVDLEGWHLNVNTPAELATARQYVDSS